MAQITDYSTLKANVASWLNRSDMTSDIPSMIQLAEAKFKRDRRFRKLVAVSASITDDSYDLPSDYQSIDSWYHDGTTYYGPIEIVGGDALPALKVRYGATGAPRAAAIVDGTARFAPVPDDTYSTKLTYWASVASLSDANTTNWLLLAHPDLYLYGTLLEAEPYLKNDERVGMWGALYKEAAEQLHAASWHEQAGGSLRRQFKPIG